MRNEFPDSEKSANYAFRLFGAIVAIFCANPVFGQSVSSCGSLTNAYGPLDYRTEKNDSRVVLEYHFTPEVEALIRGRSGTIGGDIDYTLRAIPNNHRALIAMMRLGEKEKTDKPRDSQYTVECWFERAVLWRPDDSIVRMIYSTYLNGKGRGAEALKQLETASVYAKDNPFTHYNIGLHYFDMKNYERALMQAHKALTLEFNRTELRDKLQSVGKWREPPVNPPSPPIDKTP